MGPIAQPEQIVIPEDRFLKMDPNFVVRGSAPYAIDVIHYGALLLQSIKEGLGPPLKMRSPFEQKILELIMKRDYSDVGLIPSVLRLLVYADNILVPNVDLLPGKLYGGDDPVIQLSTGGGYELKSEDCLVNMMDYADMAIKHPIGRDLALSPDSYKDALERFLGFKPWPNLTDPRQDEVAKRVVNVSAILQELRSVVNVARIKGMPAVSPVLDGWDGQTTLPDDDKLVVLKLYFDNAIYSPKPRSINEALDLRSHPRIQQWRSTMREWSTLLSKGSITEAKLVASVKEANGYIQGAKFLYDLVPAWSIYVTLPIGILKAIFGGPVVLTAGLLALSGVKCYGKLIWASVTDKNPLQNGWYLVSDSR
jgi:hypothetical protein